MTVLAKSLAHIASTLALALARSVSVSSSSMYLPWRTSATPPKPSPSSAWAIARPWGSRTPFLSVIWTFAFMPPSPSLHRVRAGHVPGAALGHDAQAPSDLLIGFRHLAEVAAEAVLVQLLIGLDVPEPAIVRADLIGENDAHVLAFPQPAKLQLEIHQLQPDPEEEAGKE